MLPFQPIKAERVNPKRLLFFGKPKSGKTTLASKLKLGNSVILDLECGTEHLEAVKIKLLGFTAPSDETNQAKKERVSKDVLELYLVEFHKLIQQYRDKNGTYPYEYVIIDTVTQLEEWCVEHATLMYMNSSQGSSFNRDKLKQLLPKDQWENVLKLPNGAGYRWLRDSFTYWINYIDSLAPNIILIGHVRDKMINKEGKELDVTDIDLTGKISSMLSASSSAIGYLYRKGKQTLINFASSDITCGSRCDHLKGKEIVVMEELKDGSIVSYWERIYLDESNSNSN